MRPEIICCKWGLGLDTHERILGSVGELYTPACRSKNDTVILIRPLGAAASGRQALGVDNYPYRTLSTLWVSLSWPSNENKFSFEDLRDLPALRQVNIRVCQFAGKKRFPTKNALKNSFHDIQYVVARHTTLIICCRIKFLLKRHFFILDKLSFFWYILECLSELSTFFQ